jgi:glycosyltransferase involved in cell wall biosynthesis
VLIGSSDVEARVSFLPNSRIGFYHGERRYLFNDKFNIDRKRKIVLCTGSLTRELLIHDIVESVSRWPDNCTLVVHGWFWPESYRQQIYALAGRFPERVYLSTDLLRQDEIDNLFASVDVGVAFYTPVDNNIRYVGHAAGKVFDFMRYGVPIVVNRDTNVYRIVEESKCGVSVSNPQEIGDAIAHLLEHYADYRKHCFAAFKKFEFQSCFGPLLRRLEAS